jgi:uncharacterized protein (UPF0335 family)
MSTAIKQEEKKGSNKGLLIILLVVIVALGGLCAYFYSQLGEVETIAEETSLVNEQKDIEIDGLLSQLDEQESEYTRIIQEKEALGYDVSDLEQERESLLEDIKTWKAKARAAGRDTKKLKKQLKLKNAQYTLELAEKDRQVDFLKSQNDSLNTTTQELHQQKHVQASIIEAQNAKIKFGSVLKAENVKITVKSKKQKTIEKQPFKATKMETVILHFNIAENNVAAYNKKEVAMRLVGPDGAVLYDLSSGGGSLKTSDNETVFYTLKQNLLFDNTSQEMTFPYFRETEWLAGSYGIQIYADGHFIGKSSFDVK